MKNWSVLIFSFLLLLNSKSINAQIAAEGDAADLLEKTLYNKKRGNLEGAIGYALLGLDQAESQGSSIHVYEFQKVLGDIYLSKRDFKKSIFYYWGIVSNAQADNNNSRLLTGYFALANSYSRMGAYLKAADYYNQVVVQYDKLGNVKGKASSMDALASNYAASNQPKKAIDAYNKLLSLAISSKLYSYISRAQEELFVQNMRLGNTNESIKYGVQYYDRIKDRGRSSDVAAAADMLAGQCLKGNQVKNALKYANAAVQKDPNRTEYLENQGLAYARNGDYARAVDILESAIVKNEKQRKSIAVARNYNLLGQIAYDEGQYKSAIGYLEKAEKLATSRNSKVSLLDTYRLLSDSYGKRGMTAQQAEYQTALKGVQLQVGDVNKVKSKVSTAKENLAESYEQQARAQISSQENQKLAQEREKLRSEQKLKELELIEHKSRLQAVELEQEKLQAERLEQELLIAEQNKEVIARSAQLTELQKEAELRRLRESDRIRELELSEQQRMALEQQKEFEAERVRQAKLMQYLIIGASLLVLALIGVAFYRTYQTNKTISEQNQNLAEQQKTILNRNIQLKKSSEAMLAMNNKLKKAHVNLKVLLKKEQETREELEMANREIKKTQVHLVQAEKMSSLGLLTAGIAHEINNPINFVSSGVQSLLQNFQELKLYIENYQKVLGLNDFSQIQKYSEVLKEDEEALSDLQEGSEELLEDVNYGIKRITEIVDGLRTFSRHDEAEVKDADINESFHSALLILKNKYKNKAEIVMDLDQGLPQIQCFPGQINQVFVNLINNALDAMDEGGKITIVTKNINEDFIEAQIQDTGSGMPEEVRDKIFDPFFTTKDVGKGTGLGLSISHGIIEKHKGTIEVESEVGVGTTFIIKLPKKLEVDDKVLEEQLLN